MHLIIPEFYGFTEKNNGYKYLINVPTEINNDILIDYKKFWNEILKQSNKINSSEYIFKEDCYKIRAGSVKCVDQEDNIDLPFDKLIKFSAVAILNRLVIEKDSK